MGSVLETYEKLLSHMLKQLPTPSPQTTVSRDRPASVTAAPGSASVAGSEAGGDVRQGLSDILEMVQKLRKHNYQDLEKLLQGLHSLRHIQVKRCRQADIISQMCSVLQRSIKEGLCRFM